MWLTVNRVKSDGLKSDEAGSWELAGGGGVVGHRGVQVANTFGTSSCESRKGRCSEVDLHR